MKLLRLMEYSIAQSTDPICSQVATYCQQGWPNHKGNVNPVEGILEIEASLVLAKIFCYMAIVLWCHNKEDS